VIEVIFLVGHLHFLLLKFFFIFQLFVDKDTIVNAVSASHDAHTYRIDNKVS